MNAGATIGSGERRWAHWGAGRGSGDGKSWGRGWEDGSKRAPGKMRRNVWRERGSEWAECVVSSPRAIDFYVLFAVLDVLRAGPVCGLPLLRFMLRLDSFDSETAEIHLHHDPRFVTQYTSSVNSRTAQTPYAAAETPSSQHRSKKRKIDRACDFCRRRKTKCDGPVMPGNICTNCIQTGRACSYV